MEGPMTALHPTTRIRFHGVAAYEIVTRAGQRILCDPFLDDNPVAPVRHDGFDKVDLVIVSHAAHDHLGETDKIALKYGCPVVCGGEVKAWLSDRGVPPTQVMATTWGIRVEVAGIRVLPLECHHWSQIRLKDGSFISGVPMAFIVYADGVRFYHYGDTAIFSDLRLHGELYRPNVGAIGIACPREIMQNLPVPGQYVTCEMDAREGLMAAEWLGLETVLPCHYCNPDGDPDVAEFMALHAEAAKNGRRQPEPVVLRAGDWIEFTPEGRRVA
jgi:L-ascorbate metabolism protein UlaG (beta-lactamase superfamily)